MSSSEAESTKGRDSWFLDYAKLFLEYKDYRQSFSGAKEPKVFTLLGIFPNTDTGKWGERAVERLPSKHMCSLIFHGTEIIHPEKWSIELQLL